MYGDREAQDHDPEAKDDDPEAKDDDPEAKDRNPEVKDRNPEAQDHESEAQDDEPEAQDDEPEAQVEVNSSLEESVRRKNARAGKIFLSLFHQILPICSDRLLPGSQQQQRQNATRTETLFNLLNL